jgi:hypothetical protein
MTRRKFLSLLGLAPVAAQLKPETPRRRVRRIRPNDYYAGTKRMIGPWDAHTLAPEDTVRILYDNEPVPTRFRVVTDEWVEWT